MATNKEIQKLAAQVFASNGWIDSPENVVKAKNFKFFDAFTERLELSEGIKKLKVVYSKEQPIVPQGQAVDDGSGNTDMRTGAAKRSTPGSTAFVPSVVGLIIGSEVIKDLIKLKKP